MDILYNNIKHALFQPCDGEMIIVLHFHLKVYLYQLAVSSWARSYYHSVSFKIVMKNITCHIRSLRALNKIMLIKPPVPDISKMLIMFVPWCDT